MSRLRITVAELERFRAKIDFAGADDCWLWTGSTTPQGYGHVRVGRGRRRRMIYAHRLAYALVHGAPGRKIVRHTCDEPSCVNPSHLLTGTPADNVADMIERGRAWWQRRQT